METYIKRVSFTGIILVVTIAVALLFTQETSGVQGRSFPTAQDVSRQWLTRHPNPRDTVEKQIIAVMGLCRLRPTNDTIMGVASTIPMIHANFFWAAPTYSGVCFRTMNRAI